MLRLMRNPKFVKILMWIVIIAFVAWLGYQLGYGGGGRTGTNPEVGKVDGTPILWTDFRRQISELREYQRRENKRPADDFDLDEQVWQQNVRAILLQQTMDRMNITVTPDEIAQEMVMNPPRGFEKVPDFQDGHGGFDRDKYRQFIATITQDRWYRITGVTFTDYENQVRLDLKLRKLQRAIESGGWVTEAALRQAYADRNETVKLRVVSAPVSLVPDTAVAVTDEEIRREYQANLASFKQPAEAKLTYVLIPKRASHADTVRAKKEITDLYERLVNGANFEELARSYSEDEASGRQGGSLGIFARGAMVRKFDSTAFATPPGHFSKPFHTRFGWHIVEVDSLVRGKRDSIAARHILIRDNAPGVETLDSLQTVAESLTAAGPNFLKKAEELGLTTGTTQWFSRDVVYPIPAVRNPLRRLVRWAFVGDVGATANPASTDQAIVVARIADRRRAGPKPLEEVRADLELKLRMRKRVDKAASLLAPIAAKIAQGQSMDQAVLGTDFAVADVGPIRRADYVPEARAGAMDGFTGAAFALTQPGQVTGVVKVDKRGAYIIDLVEHTLDWTGYDKEKTALRNQLVKQQRQSIFPDWELYLRKNANIEDYRDQFYSYN